MNDTLLVTPSRRSGHFTLLLLVREILDKIFRFILVTFPGVYRRLYFPRVIYERHRSCLLFVWDLC